MRATFFAGLVSLFLLAGCQRPPGAGVPIAEPGARPGRPSLGGGSDVGSAGDNFSDEHLAAWFTGPREPVTACVEVASDFGVPPERARAVVLRAFGEWKEYVRSRRVHAGADGVSPLVTDVLLDKKCSPSTEIAFFLGVENAAVAEARIQNAFSNPTAFVQRLAFDRVKGEGRGFVWVARAGGVRAEPAFPDWSDDDRLLAILLHELGHVYGNGHVPGTVMSESISQLLEGAAPAASLARIDHCRELVPCRDCDYVTHMDVSKLAPDALGLLSRAAATDISGPALTKLYRNPKGEFSGLDVVLEGRAVSPDIRFTFNMTRTVPASLNEAPVFKLVRDSRVEALTDESRVQYSTLLEVPIALALPNAPIFTLFPKIVGFLVIESNLASCSATHRDGRSAVHLSLVEKEKRVPFADFSESVPRAHPNDQLRSGTIVPRGSR